MPRFFCEQIDGVELTIVGEDAVHISRVLRMKVQDTLVMSDKNGYDYDCMIDRIGKDTVDLTVLKKYKNESEPALSVTLYQALPKGDKFEFIVQKAVELGVTRIVPVLTKRCVSRPDGKAMTKKVERYNKIAKEAAKQCGRGRIPEVLSLVTYQQAVDQMAQHESGIVFYELGGSRINTILPESCTDIGIMIGSEGGFSEEEIAMAQQRGIAIGSLGKLILRCETAPLVAMAIIMNITKNI